MNRMLPILAVFVLACLVASCSDDGDDRLARFAQESTQQQAEQNREMAQLNREVTHTHQDLISLQQNVEQRQVEIDRQRDQLEGERRQIAERRHRDPVIAAAIYNVGLILACLIPLALAGYLLYTLRERNDDQAVSELLIEDLTSKQPLLLPSLETELGDSEASAITEDGTRRRLPPADSC